MKNWETVEPDKVAIVGSHRYTKGRSRKIDRVVIHHNAGVRLTTERVKKLWDEEREASAHYQVEADGVIGQLVWDGDTAWHAGNLEVDPSINARSIGIEHANISGPSRWQISDKTVEAGAHLVAALCKFYKLGRPKWGVNVFPHSQFAATSCPYQLAPGGEDHNQYMARAAYWYDQMMKPSTPSTEKPKDNENMSLTAAQAKKLDTVHHELTHRFQSRYDLEEFRNGKIKESEIFDDTLVGYTLENNRRGEINRRKIEALEGKVDEILAILKAEG